MKAAEAAAGARPRAAERPGRGRNEGRRRGGRPPDRPDRRAGPHGAPTRSRAGSRRTCATPRPRRGDARERFEARRWPRRSPPPRRAWRGLPSRPRPRARRSSRRRSRRSSGRRARCRAPARPAPRSSRAWARRAGRSATSSASASARTSRRRAELLGCRIARRHARGADAVLPRRRRPVRGRGGRMMKLGTEIDEPRAGALTPRGAAGGCKVPAALPLSGRCPAAGRSRGPPMPTPPAQAALIVDRRAERLLPGRRARRRRRRRGGAAGQPGGAARSGSGSTPRTGTRPTTARSRRATRAPAPFSLTEMPYGPQVLWPTHCVQGTPGAAFHPDLETDARRPGAAQGLPAARRQLLGVLRERPDHADRARRLPARARRRRGLARRARHRLLRRLLGARRGAARVRGDAARGRLPRDRPRRLPRRRAGADGRRRRRLRPRPGTIA